MKCKVKSTLKKRKKILRGRDEKKTNHQKLDILKMLLFHSMNPINSAWQKTRLCIKDSTKTIWNWLFHFSFTLIQVLELSCECLQSLDSLSFTLLVLLHFPDAEKNSKLQQNYQIDNAQTCSHTFPKHYCYYSTSIISIISGYTFIYTFY